MDYFPILEVDQKSRVIKRQYNPESRSFPDPTTISFFNSLRCDQQDYVVLLDPQLFPETLQRKLTAVSLKERVSFFFFFVHVDNFFFFVTYIFKIHVDIKQF